ncbi:MAG: DUF1835 domain-containing protein [Saprospiraceae bacterium]
MKKYHILTGDCLKDQLQHLNAEKIILRECLVEGNVQGDSLEEIFANRIPFFEKEYEISLEEYHEKSGIEISKITEFENGATVYLWFENDLFCQVNFWFSIHTLFSSGKNISAFLVSPIKDSWMGFGKLTYEELLESFEHKKELTKTDQETLANLWTAFQKSDWTQLRSNAKKLTSKIDQIEEVVEAHIERFPTNKKYGRPEESIQKIMTELDDPSFPNVFRAFSQAEGIYGFGDLQVKRIWDEVNPQTPSK